jgi:PKD repeat protein
MNRLFAIALVLITVNLRGNPTAIFQSNAPVCQGNPVCFIDMSYVAAGPGGYITTWIWNYGDGNTDTVHFPNNPNLCHQYAFVGTYQVILQVIDNSGNSDDYTSPVTIRPRPVPNFMYFGTCLSEPTVFTDFSVTNGGGQIIGWEWNFGDGGVSNLQNPQHLYSSAGSYTVKLMITDSYNCTDSMTKQVVITPLSAGGTAGGNATILLGQGTGVMTLLGFTGGVVRWQRRVNSAGYSDIAGTAGLTSYQEIPPDTGTWNYRAVVQSGSCAKAFSSPAAILVIIAADSRIWTGASGDDWANPGNWNPAGLPEPTDRVIIPCCVSVMPHVRNNGAHCNDLTVQPGATLTVDPGITLTINGQLVLQ